jgi:hypothetical protein
MFPFGNRDKSINIIENQNNLKIDTALKNIQENNIKNLLELLPRFLEKDLSCLFFYKFVY